MDDKEFLSRLKKLCQDYDSKAGYYPDPELVGLDIYKFYMYPDIDLSAYRTGDQHTEIEDEYVKKLKI